MPVRALIAAVALVCASATVVAAQEAAPPRFDPRSWQADVGGARTRILVLGSPHLSGAGAGFDPAVLEPLLDRLAAFQPDVIAIENLSGESLHSLAAYVAVYPESASTFGRDALAIATLAQAALQLDQMAAEAEARATLANWPVDPTPAQRRRLAAVMAASGDPHSALVQWWRLPPTERREGDGATAQLVEALDALAGRVNESHLIGSRLAARLDLERVYPVDDHHSDDLMTPAVIASLVGEMRHSPVVAALMADPEMARLVEAGRRLTTPEETLETYRFLNLAETAALDARLQWRIMVSHDWPDGAGRVRMAEWETRNLRQVAHIREASASVPGGRVLVIVGAAHKAWFEAYLGVLTDVEIVDAGRVLE